MYTQLSEKHHSNMLDALRFGYAVTGTVNLVSSAVMLVMVATQTATSKPAWLAVAAGTASGAVEVAAALFADFSQVVYSGTNKHRWADYATSSPLMIVAIALLCGLDDPWLLVAIGSLQSVLMILSGAYESACPLPIFALSVIVYTVAVWGPILNQLSHNKPPEFVWIIVIGLYCVFSTFGIVYGMHSVLNIITNPEPAYISLGITSKLALQWTVYGGVVQNADGGVVSGILIGVIALGVAWFAYVRRILK